MKIKFSILTAFFFLFSFASFSQNTDSMRLADSARWTKELKDGKITAKDFQTLLLANKDLAKMDSLEDAAFEAGTKRETLEMVKLKLEGLKQIEKSKWRFPQHYFKAQITEFKIAPLIEKKDFLIYAMQFIAGCADGANQAIVYHHAGAGTHFWDYNTSWKNKYRNYDAGDTRSAFFGSKSFFVGITDGNHLTRMGEPFFLAWCGNDFYDEKRSWLGGTAEEYNYLFCD